MTEEARKAEVWRELIDRNRCGEPHGTGFGSCGCPANDNADEAIVAVEAALAAAHAAGRAEIAREVAAFLDRRDLHMMATDLLEQLAAAPAGVPTAKEQRCRQCHQLESSHCDMDEPGVDHPVGCMKMHHEFKVALPPEEGK